MLLDVKSPAVLLRQIVHHFTITIIAYSILVAIEIVINRTTQDKLILSPWFESEITIQLVENTKFTNAMGLVYVFLLILSLNCNVKLPNHNFLLVL